MNKMKEASNTFLQNVVSFTMSLANSIELTSDSKLHYLQDKSGELANIVFSIVMMHCNFNSRQINDGVICYTTVEEKIMCLLLHEFNGSEDIKLHPKHAVVTATV